MFIIPEQYRVNTDIRYQSREGDNFGTFLIPLYLRVKLYAYAMAVSAEGWEHVSVSLRTHKKAVDRTPTWEEMCKIKDLFWEPTDTVVQYHPPHSEYVNNHKYCLHLWRKIGYDFPLPDHTFVGTKD